MIPSQRALQPWNDQNLDLGCYFSYKNNTKFYKIYKIIHDQDPPSI